MIKKTIVRCTSANRSTNDNICSFDVYLKQKLQNVFRVVPQLATIPNAFYNINTFDNEFKIEYNTAPITITLPVGFYTLAEIAVQIESRLQLIDDYVFIQDEFTKKLLITHGGGGDIVIKNGNMNKNLGFVNGQTSTAGQVRARDLPDLRGVSTAFIHLSFIENGHFLTESRDGQNVSLTEDVICVVPITVDFGETVQWENTDNELLTVTMGGLRNISYFRITLTDEDNNILDTNGLDWSFEFIAYE